MTLTLPSSIRAGNAGRGTGASSSFFYMFLFLTVRVKCLWGKNKFQISETCTFKTFETLIMSITYAQKTAHTRVFSREGMDPIPCSYAFL